MSQYCNMSCLFVLYYTICYDQCTDVFIDSSEDFDGENTSSPLFCSYLLLNPFQLVTTPYCNMTLSYLCTLGKKKPHLESDLDTKYRNKEKQRLKILNSYRFQFYPNK